jgi:hypothetical protein
MSQHIFFSSVNRHLSIKPENKQEDLAVAKIPSDFIWKVIHGVILIVRNSNICLFAPLRKHSRSLRQCGGGGGGGLSDQARVFDE